MKIVALIPARAGSKRVPGKNTRLLGGKPLIQWTIEAAQQSGIFEYVCVFTEDYGIASLVIEQTSAACRKRSDASATDDAPDILWVREALDVLTKDRVPHDAFAILRPTSPFRTAATITRACGQFFASRCSSIRAVEPVSQHPGKMWQRADSADDVMVPFVPDAWPFPEPLAPLRSRVPWHSLPTQTLPRVYVQNASLEMAWTWCVTTFDSISGPKVAPFFTDTLEGFDINTETDWQEAERIVTQRLQLSV